MVRRHTFWIVVLAMAMWASEIVAPVVWAQQSFEAERFTGTALEPFARAAQRIRLIEEGRVTAVFWDFANVRDEDFRVLGGAGFNEVIVDGHRFGEGTIALAQAEAKVLAAWRGGIVSVKFVRGSPDWAGAKRADAREKVTRLASRIRELKERLARAGEREAAEILRGVVVNVEPYADKAWRYDFSGYVEMHEELERIVRAQGLSYETFDAFWIGQTRHESGNEMTGYRAAPQRTSYVMSYRADGYETFEAADFFAARVPHVVGFDLVDADPVGFLGRAVELPSAVAECVDATLSASDRPGFRGIFVHASRIEEIVRFIREASGM